MKKQNLVATFFMTACLLFQSGYAASSLGIKAFDEPLSKLDGRAHVMLVQEGFECSGYISTVGNKHCADISTLIKNESFTGETSSTLQVTSSVDGVSYFIMVGVGKQDDESMLSVESLRRALGTVVRILEKHKISSMALQLPSNRRFGRSAEYIGQQVASILAIASYKFDTYISQEDEPKKEKLDVNISCVGDSLDAFSYGIEKGLHIGRAVNDAQKWINLPPNVLTPTRFADEAVDIAKQYGLSYQVFDRDKIKSLGMGGLAAVTQGSDEDCRFIILEHKVSDTAPTIGLVGKGITFDTGGYSLKSSAGMEIMKMDMSGAAAVLATMEVVGKYKPNVNVVAVMPMSENMINGSAYRVSDIIRFYNGKTAEIKNTDAEGRLVLADGLAYITKHYKLDAVLDIATLTGACWDALGRFYSGMLGHDKKLLDRVNKAGLSSGDAVWRLPLTHDYSAGLKNDVADLCNIGKGNLRAGTIMAAAFLEAFVGDTPWVHLDIAGTAFDVPNIPYYRSNMATGVGVRLFVDLIENWK